MKRHFTTFLIITSYFICLASHPEKQLFRVVCYNVENLFDCVNDSTTADEEYLPGGMRGWNYDKYIRKQANIAKVLVAIGEWQPPALVGLCEIESRKCLVDLTRYSSLKNWNYRFAHHESPDARGVDVALLYQPDKFEPIANQPIPINFPFAPNSKTRDILYVSGITPSADTLHVFVCHFPSRLGGELESENRREYVASVLKAHVDSIFSTSKHANILIMGDFNDYPTDNSIDHVLQAKRPENIRYENELYNLMYPFHKLGKGTHKHNGEWGALDQIIVSGNLLNPASKFFTLPADVRIFDADFLLEDDKNYLGKQPFRTYVGFKYNGGFSDHLPVYTDFWY